MIAQHHIVTDSYHGIEKAVTQNLGLKILEEVNKRNFHVRVTSKLSYSIHEKELKKKLYALGTAISADPLPMIITDRFILYTFVTDNLDTGYVVIGIGVLTTQENVDSAIEEVEALFEPYKRTGNLVEISWAVMTRDGIRFYDLNCEIDEKIYKEAYPFIDDVDLLIQDYFQSEETVLILLGKPGTGKTRLLRYMTQKLSSHKGRMPRVLYSMEPKVFGEDEFFLKFLTYNYDALVLEDIDLNLKSRKNGNEFMHKLLGGSDGFVRNKNKKIILTTNLPNTADMDEALIRRGRCFDVIHTRNLNAEEANALVVKLNANHVKEFTKDTCLADVYAAARKK